MYYSLESFIRFCDENQIAQESVFTSIKNGLIKLFTKLVIFLDKKVKKMKDGKVKKVLQGLLKRAKDGLSKSKTLNENNPELVEILKQEADDIQKEAEKVDTEEVDKVEVKEQYNLQQGKALVIDTRTRDYDYLPDYLFGPELPKSIKKELLNCKGELWREESKLREPNILKFSKKLECGYYFIGVAGILQFIYEEAGLNADEYFYRDRAGRRCEGVVGYLTTDSSVTFGSDDIRLVYEKTSSVWDKRIFNGWYSPGDHLKTQFQ